jgi:hypothetical protein
VREFACLCHVFKQTPLPRHTCMLCYIAYTCALCHLQVRRKADPAKDLVREFVGKWQDNPAVAGDASHDEMRSECWGGGGWQPVLDGSGQLPSGMPS